MPLPVVTATDAQLVDGSTGGFRLYGTVQVQGVDAIPSDRPQISEVTIYGTPAAGEVYRVELGPTYFAYGLSDTPTAYDYTASGASVVCCAPVSVNAP